MDIVYYLILWTVPTLPTHSLNSFRNDFSHGDLQGEVPFDFSMPTHKKTKQHNNPMNKSNKKITINIT